MATADEILSQLATEEDKVLVINNDLRTITIPQTVKMLGVESDEDVLRLHFRMPKTYGETDLSEFVIRINYINAKGIGDIYTVSDTSIVDDTITFSWLISRNATAYKGSVRFIVCLKLYDETGLLIKEYNTTVSSLPVLEGLEVSDIIIEQNPDIIEKILLRLDKLENSGGVNVSGAQVGQTIRVSAVDESGKPTAWEASDFPEQIQSDYNQNDETAADYVKNRPFYDGGLKKELALTYSEFAYTGQASLYSSEITIKQKKPMFEEGDKIFVEVNGNQFSDTIILSSELGMLCAGQVNELLNNEFDKVEFVLTIMDGLAGNDTIYRYTLYCKLDSVENATANIYREITDIKQIDRKFLPNISINKKSLDSDGNLNLVPSDIGASKIIYLEETDKHVTETQSEIQNYIDSGYDVRLIANSLGGKCMIRLDENRYVHISIEGDLRKLKFYSAFISSDSTVTFIEWTERNWYPDLDQREIYLSKDSEGNWTCNKDLSYISTISNYHPMLVVALSVLGIAAISDGAIDTASEIKLSLTGIEQPELDSATEKKRYIFSGTYGAYNITVTIGPTDSSNVSVTVQSINSLPKITEADEGKFLRVSGHAYVLEALTDVSEVGA